MGATRLTIDDRGIRVESVLAGGWRMLGLPAWSADWSDVDYVTANPLMGLVQLWYGGQLVSTGLYVRNWDAEGATATAATRAILSRLDATDTDLWRALAARGMFDPNRFAGRERAADFEVMKHPATRWALVLALVLLAYGVADLPAKRDLGLLVFCLFVGVYAGGQAFLVLYRARRPQAVPSTVAMAIALFMTTATSIAAWAALSRFGPIFLAS